MACMCHPSSYRSSRAESREGGETAAVVRLEASLVVEPQVIKKEAVVHVGKYCC